MNTKDSEGEIKNEVTEQENNSIQDAGDESTKEAQSTTEPTTKDLKKVADTATVESKEANTKSAKKKVAEEKVEGKEVEAEKGKLAEGKAEEGKAENKKTEKKKNKPSAKKAVAAAEEKPSAEKDVSTKQPVTTEMAPAVSSNIDVDSKPVPLKSAPARNDKEYDKYNKYDKRDKRQNTRELTSLTDVASEITPPKTLTAPAKGKVFYATGRRKTSSARVFVQGGKGSIRVNGSSLEKYFPMSRIREAAIQPLTRLEGESMFDINITVKGGGFDGQAGAIRHGLARALLQYDEELRKFLRKNGYLTRDSRSVERKKVGFRKARKSPQFSKR